MSNQKKIKEVKVPVIWFEGLLKAYGAYETGISGRKYLQGYIDKDI